MTSALVSATRGMSRVPVIALQRSNESIDDPELRHPDCVLSITEHNVGHARPRPIVQQTEAVIVTAPAVEQVSGTLPRRLSLVGIVRNGPELEEALEELDDPKERTAKVR